MVEPDFDALALKVGEMCRLSSDKSRDAFRRRIWRVIDERQVKDPAKRSEYYRKIRQACTKHSGNARSTRAAYTRPSPVKRKAS